MNDIIRKTMPAADTAIKIAQALDVTAEFLFTGENNSGANPLIAADQADWVMVPHYRLSEFTESGKPEPVETIPIRKDWLNRSARAATGLWITDLPITLPDLGEEGDSILCRDAEHHSQEGIYLYFYNGIPIVRPFKAAFPAEADPFEDVLDLRIAARVLGTIKLRPF